MAKWTKTWPKKNGFYWFYGWRFGKYNDFVTGKPEEPEISFVEVRKVSNGFLHITNGYTLEEDADGMWLKVNLPELPKLD
jgi:hypothetical protein